MTRVHFILLFILISTLASAQQSITNMLTKEHVWIPNTKASFIPPKGFVNVPYTMKFRLKDDLSQIVTLNVPRGDSNNQRLLKENLKKKNIKEKY